MLDDGIIYPQTFFNNLRAATHAVMTDEPATLLIVDDIQENIALLYHVLTRAHFKVFVASDGKSGLNQIKSQKIDLILLDIMMPEMDGFTVCQHLKSDPQTRHIPVIFMSALADTVDKVRGFSVGAADYITKPFQTAEVLARINTHLNLSKLQQQLKIQTQALEKRNLELDAFAHTVAHDLKNPLSIVLSCKKLLYSTLPEELKQDENIAYAISLILRAGQKMEAIIKGLLLLAGVSQTDSQQNRLQHSFINMRQLVEQTLEQQLITLIQQTQGQIIIDDNLPNIHSYAPWLEEVWANYLSNGLKYGGTPPVLRVGGEKLAQNKIRFWVKDNGQGLNHSAQQRIFTPFTRLHQNIQRSDSDGLGLSIVQQIIHKLGGEVGVNSQVGQGSTFYFILTNTMSTH